MKKILHSIIGPLIIVAILYGLKILFPARITFITEIGIFTIYVLGCNLLYGYIGLVSFGQPFYLSVGAYSTAIYLAYMGTNPFTAILVSLVVGMLVGLVLGPFFMRMRGAYFALVNMAICTIGDYLVTRVFMDITRGDDGLWFRARMTATALLDIRIAGEFFLFTLVVLFIVFVLYRTLNYSVLGMSFRACKSDQRKMRFIGYNTLKIKWLGFIIANILSALAGSLFAINFGFVNPNLGTPMRASDVLIATVIGGPGTIYGPLIGAAIFLGLRDIVTRYIQQWEFFVGALTILILFRFEKGVWGYLDKTWKYFRDHFLAKKKGESLSIGSTSPK